MHAAYRAGAKRVSDKAAEELAADAGTDTTEEAAEEPTADEADAAKATTEDE